MHLDIRFSIDEEESDLTGTLVIAVSHPITYDALRQATLHKELFQLLYQQEFSYRNKIRGSKPIGGNTPLSVFHIHFLATTRVLELLAGSCAFYFRNKPLICDFLAKTEFYYHIDACEANMPKISGKLKSDNHEIDLKECDFLCTGAYHYYIKGIILRPINTEIAWKDLKQLYRDPSKVSLSQIQKDYADDGPDQPKLIYGHQVEKALEMTTQPLPLLVLTDRLGAFANLWMSYPVANSEERKRVSFHDPAPWIKDVRSKTALKRQLDSEKQWEKDLLESDFTAKMAGTSHYYCPVDCVAKSLTFLLEMGWPMEDCEGNRICRLTSSDLHISSESDSILVTGKIRYEEHAVDLKDVVGAFNRRDRFVQLGGNRVGLMPKGLDSYGLNGLAEEGEIVQEGVRLPRNRVGAISELFDSTANFAYDDTFANLKEKLLSFVGLKLALPSASFKGDLRPYQQEGVNWLAFLYEYGFHGLLADDMGLGKTVQVLAFLSRLTLVKPILIVLPTSLIFNWKRELEHFLPDMPVVIYQGAQRTPWPSDLSSPPIILTSYATLRIDLPLFQSHEFQCIILDEAQTIKNPHTLTAQAIHKLKGGFRLSLTGTPVENHLNEIWAHFRFIMPDLFGSEKKFNAELEAGGADFRYLQKMRRKMRPFMLRRKKEDVAKDLPERIEQVVWVEMPPEQQKVYDELLAGFKSNLFKKVALDGVGKHRMEVLEAILRLRQICCHPLLAIGHSEEFAKAPSAKFEALLQDLDTAVEEGRKVLVYSQFTSMLQLIAKELRTRKWNFVYLDGQTKDREKVVNQFQEDPETLIFLISLKAGGIGLNLTAADYVFLYDPWWNEAVENQAIDRAHRIGRIDTVIAKRYVTVETIEEKMMALKAAKRALAADIMQEDIPISQLTIDDLHYLLET